MSVQTARVLCASDLVFAYRKRTVIDGLNLSIGSGRTALLGPNGAGKSTLIRVLAGAAAQQRGAVSLDGREMSQAELRGRIAWMPQQVPVLAGLNVREQVTYAAWLAGLAVAAAEQSAERALKTVRLTELAHAKPAMISGGELRRLGLAQTIATGCTTLLLDEPSAGLDPEQRRLFGQVLRRLDDETQVLVSTHDVGDVLDVYDRVVILDHGQVLFSGTREEFLGHGTGAKPAESAYLALLGRQSPGASL